MKTTICLPNTNTTTAAASSAPVEPNVEAMLRDMAYALKLARRISNEIRRENEMPTRIVERSEVPQLAGV